MSQLYCPAYRSPLFSYKLLGIGPTYDKNVLLSIYLKVTQYVLPHLKVTQYVCLIENGLGK